VHATAPRLVILAFLLAVLAGYVDALGFITLNGVFVSFMSGNSTRLGVALGLPSLDDIAAPAAMIGAFLAGVTSGSLIAHRGVEHRIPRVLSVVTLMLMASAVLHAQHPRLAMAFMAAAMGAMNTTFERDGEVFIAVTYMTGTLVKMGQHIAAALRGESRSRWVRHAMLWLGLTGGACLGAATYRAIALDGLWLAAGTSAILTFLARGFHISRHVSAR